MPGQGCRCNETKALEHHAFPPALAFPLNNRLRRAVSPPSKLLDRLGIMRTDVVIDFGCGPGFYTTEIARRAGRTVAVDVSPAMLEKALKAARKVGVNIETLQGDGTRLLLEDGTVDVLFLAWVWHEVGRKGEVLREFSRVLKPQGRLAMVENVKFPLGAPKVDAGELNHEVEASGFELQQRLPLRVSAILVFRKAVGSA